MSVCVGIRIENIPQPDVCLKLWAEPREQIMGGRLLSQAETRMLETLWADFLKKNEDRINGETFNVNRDITFKQ